MIFLNEYEINLSKEMPIGKREEVRDVKVVRSMQEYFQLIMNCSEI
jgi:hypothetical protein